VPPSRLLTVSNEGPVSERPPREDTLRLFQQLPEGDRSRARVVAGHTVFGIHEAIPHPSTYITLLRDPVALTISHYRFVQRSPRHFLHEAAMKMSLSEFVDSGVSLETDNSQARAISGDTHTPFGRCSEEMYGVAVENLASHFSVVGVTERFDQTLALLQISFGWNQLRYVPVNVSPGHQRRASPDPATLELIEGRNRFDRRLHQRAAERIDEAFSSSGVDAETLARLRRRNALYRPWGELTYALPRRVRASARHLLGVDR
jgi:hypothetical protein